MLGRFGSFQKGEATLDDREDYMETKPRRPTSDRKRPYGSCRSYRVISVTSIFRKDLERPETTTCKPALKPDLHAGVDIGFSEGGFG